MIPFFSVLFPSLLFRLAYPPFDLAPLALLAITLFAARWKGRPGAAGAGFAFVFFAHLSLVPWLANFWGPAPVLVALCVALYHAGFGVALARDRPILAALGWAVGDLLMEFGPLPYPWGLLGQAAAPLPGTRLAARFLTTHGLGLAILLCAMALVSTRGRTRTWLVVALVSSEFVLRFAPIPASAALPIALVETNFVAKDEPLRNPAARTSLRLSTAEARASGARLVVWPETVLLDDIDASPELSAWLTELARWESIQILTGFPDLDTGSVPPGKFNAAVLLDTTGAEIGRYRKVILVPFGEYPPFATPPSLADRFPEGTGDFDPSETAALLPTEWGPAGILICYEDLFGLHARGLARRGARLLINLTNDGWARSRWAEAQHASFSRMSAVEAGLPLYRATNTGVSCAWNERGEAIPVRVLRLGSGGSPD